MGSSVVWFRVRYAGEISNERDRSRVINPRACQKKMTRSLSMHVS